MMRLSGSSWSARRCSGHGLVGAAAKPQVEIAVHVPKQRRTGVEVIALAKWCSAVAQSVLIGRRQDAEPHMRVGQRRVEGKRPFGRRADHGRRLARAMPAHAGANVKELGQRRVRERVAGIERNRRSVELLGLRICVRRVLRPDEVTGHQVRLVRGHCRRIEPRRSRASGEATPEFAHDCRRNVVLHGEHVGQLAIVPFRPAVTRRRRR